MWEGQYKNFMAKIGFAIVHSPQPDLLFNSRPLSNQSTLADVKPDITLGNWICDEEGKKLSAM